jgi:hypothetical protein
MTVVTSKEPTRTTATRPLTPRNIGAAKPANPGYGSRLVGRLNPIRTA